MHTNLRLILISILIITLQTTVVTFTSIGNILPDLLLIWIVYLAVTRGQMTSTTAGFAVGLTMDLLSGQFLGLAALTKTIAGFLAGYFYNENKIDVTLGNYQFIVIVAIASFVHNIVYFILFTRGSDVGLLTAVVTFGLSTTLYTAVAALIPMFIFSRRHRFR